MYKSQRTFQDRMVKKRNMRRRNSEGKWSNEEDEWCCISGWSRGHGASQKQTTTKKPMKAWCSASAPCWWSLNLLPAASASWSAPYLPLWWCGRWREKEILQRGCCYLKIKTRQVQCETDHRGSRYSILFPLTNLLSAKVCTPPPLICVWQNGKSVLF